MNFVEGGGGGVRKTVSPSPAMPAGGPPPHVHDDDGHDQSDDLFQDLADFIGGGHGHAHPPSVDPEPTGHAHKGLDRSAILRETVRQVRTLTTTTADSSSASSSSSLLNALMPKELQGSLVLDALDGFMFLVNGEGLVEVVSDQADDLLGPGACARMRGQSIYRSLHQGDHARFSPHLLQDSNGALANPGTGKSSRVFTCRFGRSLDDDDEGDEPYVSLQVSSVPIPPSEELAKFGCVSVGARLFCLARRVPASERKQHFPVELFTTKLDASTFNIELVDTTGMNRLHGDHLRASMQGKRLLEDFCHPEDQNLLRKHLAKCLSASNGDAVVSPVYRLRLLAANSSYVHVRTKSKFFRASQVAHNPTSFVAATHSIIGETDFCKEDLPRSYLQLVPMQHLGSLGQGGMDKRFAASSQSTPPLKQLQQSASTPQQQSAAGISINNNVNMQLKGGAAGGSNPKQQQPAATSEKQQKNLLLKQLLNTNFSSSRLDSAPSPPGFASPPAEGSNNNNQQQPGSPSSDLSNSRILQLLTQHLDNIPSTTPPHASPQSAVSSSSPSSTTSALFSPSPGGGVSAATAGGGYKRPSPAGNDDGEPSAKKLLAATATTNADSGGRDSVIEQQNPHLTEMLAKPNSDIVPPPPVPMKWHQEPREMLPKVDEALKLPPSSRAAKSPVASIVSAAPPPAKSPANNENLLGDLDSSLTLSDILDGVIDIQEKSPTGRAGPPSSAAQAPAPAPAASFQPASVKQEPPLDIANIEKYLASSEGNMTMPPPNRHAPTAGSSLTPASTYQRSQSSPAYGSVQTMAGRQQLAASSSSSSNQLLRRQSSGPVSNPVNLVPRMSELLQVVPPNVSIPECPDLDSLAMLQQRRLMSSGGTVVSAAARAAAAAQPSRQQQQPAAQAAAAAAATARLQQRSSGHHMMPSPSSSSAPALSPGTSTPTTNLLVQQLNAGPMNAQQQQRQQLPQQQQQRLQRPPMQQQQHMSSYSMQQRHPSNGFLRQQQQQQQQMLQHQPPGGRVRYPVASQQQPLSPMLSPQQRQQQQMVAGNNRQQQQFMNQQLPSQMQQQQMPRPLSLSSPTSNADMDENRSLLQQLLSSDGGRN